ncbi:cysteine desulfurase [Capsulimonas corticalis]|uniref:cysteine desulfurase n=1 Tax=Capsulimonas corticalis TaxID=2219043 RepID=A0A402CPB2_9BACT|nr:cysteine desulfurase [Capsulimonas corticalis]BDI33139.1 cysteine desulfurase [Capsulimonas corticalis]
MAAAPQTAKGYDVQAVRADFPILHTQMHGKPLVYLDNAATTQKPQSVIDTLLRYYTEENANIHRSPHLLAEKATRAYEGARVKVKEFIHAEDAHEIIFVRNATEGVNLVASTYGRKNIGPGDEILISTMEHHCNIVPWQMLCEEKGAKLKVIPINDAGELLMDEFDKLLTERTKIVAVVHMSNVLGTINPIEEIITKAHAQGVPVLIDAAQSAYHIPLDVQALDADFLVFSGHKLYGPTGIGVLYGKTALLEAMPPYQGGGDMIATVTFEHTEYNDLPYKFEAGTPHIAGAAGLGAAIDYIQSLGVANIAAYEHELMEYGTQALSEIEGFRMIGTARNKASVYSFTLGDIHPLEIGTLLDRQGIAIRTGQHCAHPVLQRLGVPSTARASLGLYNTREEIDALVVGLRKVQEFFAK